MFFSFLLFSLELNSQTFFSLAFNKQSLNLEINFTIPDHWKLYSNRQSIHGAQLKIIPNDSSKNIASIEVDFPQSIKDDDDFFYIGKQKIPIKIFFNNQFISLDESDFLIINYIMCNKESGECLRESQKILLKIESIKIEE